MEISKYRILIITGVAGCIAAAIAAVLPFNAGGTLLMREPEESYEVSFQTEAGTKLHAVFGEEEEYTHASASDAGTAEYTVNINTATAQELDKLLPGIGEKKAEAIIEHRQRVGGFRSVEELIEVDGIGPGLLDDIRPYCRLED